jgi:uncharacterized protein (DUF58 family)
LQQSAESYNHFMMRIKLRQAALPIGIVFLLVMQLTHPSRAWTVLLVPLTGIFISAYVWTRSLGANLQLRRETRLGWVQVGGQIEERITLSNTSLFPASWIKFKDHSTLPDFNANKSLSISSGFFEQWNFTAPCNQRGFFHLGDADILTGDPFGIFEVTIHASQRTSVLVLPQIATLPEMRIAPSGAFGDGQPRRNAPEQTIHASTVREYAHGDSTRLIHWPTTARTNKVFVRLMESAPEGDWWILLDLDKENMLGSGWDSIEEQSVTLAASLADKGLRSRKSVGLISSGKELTWITPKKGEGQRWEIMQALALAKQGDLSLNTVLERIRPSLGKHHSLIIVTASTKPDWLNSLLPLSKRGIIPTIILLDASTFGGDVSAKNVAADLELHGIECHVIPHGIIKPPEAITKQHVHWTWHTTSTGEFVPVRS